jgi:hypothetical protein
MCSVFTDIQCKTLPRSPEVYYCCMPLGVCKVYLPGEKPVCGAGYPGGRDDATTYWSEAGILWYVLTSTHTNSLHKDISTSDTM